MPFNMWLYGRTLETSSGINIPYVKMVRSLAYITAPVGMGMLIFYKFPKVAPYITKVSGPFSFCRFIILNLSIPKLHKSKASELFTCDLTHG